MLKRKRISNIDEILVALDSVLLQQQHTINKSKRIELCVHECASAQTHFKGEWLTTKAISKIERKKKRMARKNHRDKNEKEPEKKGIDEAFVCSSSCHEHGNDCMWSNTEF